MSGSYADERLPGGAGVSYRYGRKRGANHGRCGKGLQVHCMQVAGSYAGDGHSEPRAGTCPSNWSPAPTFP